MARPTQQGTYVDLKNCIILLEDGYSKTGAVNNASGYAAGASTVVIDGLTASTVLPVGVRVKFASDDNEYYVASTTETTGTTTSIVLDKPLVEALTDNQVITFGPRVLEIKVGDGNLTYSETKNREYKMNRGRLDQVRDGDEAPVEISTTFAWTNITAHSTATVPTVEDVLKRRGPAASWTSTGEGCEPYCVNMTLVNIPLFCQDVDEPVEKIAFEEFRYEKLDHDTKAGTVSISGKSNTTEATVTRLDAY